MPCPNTTSRPARAFTLLELLVVVAIIGIIAAILLPNLLGALEKGRQKRTMSDIRHVGTSWMSWLTDQVGSAAAGAGKVYPATMLSGVSYTELFGYLHPTSSFFYMQEIPQRDGWGYPYGFALNSNLVHTSVVLICSAARDGIYQNGADCNSDDWSAEPFVLTNYDQDIVWADGYFVRWPE